MLKRGGAAALGVALGCLAAGCGGGDDTSQGAPEPEGCVDIVVSPALLPNPGTWGPSRVPIRGGLWRSDAGLHVAWLADKGSDFEKGLVRRWLVVSTFDPRTGDLLQHQLTDLYPGPGSEDQYVTALRGRADGTFAYDYSYWGATVESISGSFLRIADLDAPDDFTETVLFPGGQLLERIPSDVGWDGEAFAVHAWGGGELHVARVAEDGTLVLPYEAFGVTGSPGYGEFGYKATTDVTSGRSFVFEANSSRRLNGHERDGTQLSWTAGSGYPVPVDGRSDSTSGRLAVAADSDGGAWVAWKDLDAIEGVAGHVGAGGLVDADGVLEQAPEDHGTFFNFGVEATDTGSWVAAVFGSGIYGFDIAPDGSTRSRNLVVDRHPDAKNFDIRSIQVVDSHGERWLHYIEYPSGAPAIIRVLRVDTGCTYPPTEPAQ